MYMYYLDENNHAEPCSDVKHYDWLQTVPPDDRTGCGKVVSQDYVSENEWVSTVFLGMDHSVDAKPPILFETLIFGGPMDGKGRRYSTWNEASEGHETFLRQLRGMKEVRAD